MEQVYKEIFNGIVGNALFFQAAEACEASIPSTVHY